MIATRYTNLPSPFTHTCRQRQRRIINGVSSSITRATYTYTNLPSPSHIPAASDGHASTTPYPPPSHSNNIHIYISAYTIHARCASPPRAQEPTNHSHPIHESAFTIYTHLAPATTHICLHHSRTPPASDDHISSIAHRPRVHSSSIHTHTHTYISVYMIHAHTPP